MPCVPECQRGLRANVLACQHGLRTSVTACQRAKSVPVSHFYVPTCQRAIRRSNVLTWHANVPNGVPIFQLGVPTCQKTCQFFKISLWNVKGNLDTLLLCKKFYIFFDIIVINIIGICVVIKTCIILHFYISCHVKEKCVEFFFFIIFFFFALSLEIKTWKTWFLYTTKNKGFLEFSTAKTICKINDTLNSLWSQIVIRKLIVTTFLSVSSSDVFEYCSAWSTEATTRVFCKKSCSLKFRNIHRKTSVLDNSLFNKVALLEACNFIKKVFSCEYFEICKDTYSEKHLRAAASVK